MDKWGCTSSYMGEKRGKTVTCTLEQSKGEKRKKQTSFFSSPPLYRLSKCTSRAQQAGSEETTPNLVEHSHDLMGYDRSPTGRTCRTGHCVQDSSKATSACRLGGTCPPNIPTNLPGKANIWLLPAGTEAKDSRLLTPFPSPRMGSLLTHSGKMRVGSHLLSPARYRKSIWQTGDSQMDIKCVSG